MSKALIKISLHCEKILEGKENEINITTESTHVMILRIYKLIQYNVEADMNKIDDEIFCGLQKISYFIMMRVVQREIIFLFWCINKSDQIWDINLFCVLPSHWVDLRHN